MRRFSLPVALCVMSVVAAGLSAAPLTVRVRDTAGAPVVGARVVAVAYSTATVNRDKPDGGHSSVMTVDSAGIASGSIEPGFEYQILVSSQGMAPSVRDQIVNPVYPTVRTTGGSISIDRWLSPDAGMKTSGGAIRVDIEGLAAGCLLFCDVKNIATGNPVAYGSALSAGGVTSVYIDNVLAAAAGSYRVSAGIPQLDAGCDIIFSTAVAPGGTAVLALSSSSFTASGRVERRDEPVGQLSFHGQVTDEGLTGLRDCIVTVKKKTGSDWNNPDDIAETRTDASGYFAFYGIGAGLYAVQITRTGFAGEFITNGIGLTPGNYWVTNDSSGKTVLRLAKGKISGYIVAGLPDGGTMPVPNANVSINPDGGIWIAAANPLTPTSAGGLGQGNYYTTGFDRSGRGNANVRSDAHGYFEINGLAKGNYYLTVWSDLVPTSDGYCFNTDGSSRYGNYTHTAADRRITVSTFTVSAGTPQEHWQAGVYCNDMGASVYQYNISTGPLTVLMSTITAQGGTVRGTITFDAPVPVTISPDEPIMIMAYERSNSGQLQKRFFTAITGTITGRTTDYVLNVATSTSYWIEMKSQGWGMIGKMDMNADFTQRTALTGFNFKVGRAGVLKGVVRLPDGRIFKRKWYSGDNTEDRIRVSVQGSDVNCYGDQTVQDDGIFEITGLIPGTYQIRTVNEHGTSDWSAPAQPLEWPNAQLAGITVRAGQETWLEIQLKTGALVAPRTPALPLIVHTSTSVLPYTQYAITQFPSATGVSRDVLGALIGKDDAYAQNMAFQYDDTASSWGASRRILSGRYDYYLARVDRFSPGDSRMEQSDHFSVTFLSQLKNVEINYDPLKADATTYLEFESGTLGSAVLKGRVTGVRMFTQKDVDAISRGGVDKFLTYIPSVMLYDAGGQLKGFGKALPTLARLPFWDERINQNSFTLEWLQSELASYPVMYRIERLPAGSYVAVFETPNYPPLMKKVTLTAGGAALDVNFDENIISGSSVTGVVVSTDALPVADATVVLSHRTETKTLLTDASGRFGISGLAPGTWRMHVAKPGYVPAAEKFGVGADVRRFDGDNAVVMTRADATLSGTVYSQKMPTPKVIAGARVVAYNEDYNTRNPGKMLPVISAKTDEQGNFTLDGIVSSDKHLIYVIASGKLLEWKTMGGNARIPLAPGANTGCEFTLKSLPPRLKINMSKIYENGRFLYRFLIESPTRIVNAANPAAAAAPYCRYCPVVAPEDAFDPDTATEVLPNVGPEVVTIDGDRIYNYSLKIPVIEDREYYKLRVEASDGSQRYSEDLLFGPRIEAKSKKDLKDEIAQGGDVSIDDTGYDATAITVDPGSITPAGSEVSSISENNVDIPIGGFLSAMPNFNLSRTVSGRATALSRVWQNIVASDVYEMSLTDAQLNKSLSLSLKFDMAKVGDGDLAGLGIYQFNDATGQWRRITGAVSVDPVDGVVSVDVASIGAAADVAPNSPRAGRAAVRNGMFAVNRAAATSQSGLFAVFKQDPATAKAYAGGGFSVYNFPNPFNLKTKTVTLRDVSSGFSQTVGGTLIKYSLPSGKNGRVVLYIYNLAGELVREIDEGARTGGFHYYVEWDGRNSSGEECASGVYFLIAKLDGSKLNDKPMKLAIVK